MDIFEIHDEEINVQEIMREIRDKIRTRKHLNIDQFQNESNQSSYFFGMDKVEIAAELTNLKINSDINNESYKISSHRPIMGAGLVKGRHIVNAEVRRYVDPMIFKQTNFNKGVISTFNHMGRLYQKLDDLESKLYNTEDRVSQIENLDYKVETLQAKINDEHQYNTQLIHEIKNEIYDIISKLKTDLITEYETKMNSFIASINNDLEKKAWLSHVLNENISSLSTFNNKNITESSDINYLDFENKFRGSSEHISSKQNSFLSYFKDCQNVLDIGCGRGEFVELLNNNGIIASGIDLDSNMVEYCLSKGLNVHLGDAISYIQKLEDSSLDGIFIDQVVEHLEPTYLVNLLKLCIQKLKYGCYLIAETVNPLSFYSFSNFYLDMTHIKPIHPETLKFLFQSTGFKEINTIFSSPVPEAHQLRKMVIRDGISEIDKYQTQIYNQNIEKLNNILYGAQDYAIIGKKQ